MDNTLTIKFNDSQYHFLSELAKDQYRTPEELVALLIAEGFNFYRETVDFCIKKLETDRDPEGKEFQWYELEDQKTLFKNLVFQQREASN
jgi:arginine repressor